MFDNTGTLDAVAFNFTFNNCALSVQSMQNILVSMDTNGASNVKADFEYGTNAGKSTWTEATNTAYNNLISKGWTISFNP